MTGTARITSAIVTFQKPRPTTASRMAMTARLGSARPMLDTLIARNPPRWTCPSQMPIGSAISAAMKKPAANSFSVCRTLSCSRSDQWSPMNLKALAKSFTLSGRPCSGPWRKDALQEGDQRVGDDRETGREHCRGDQLGLEASAIDRIEDRRAEPLVHHEGGNRGKADHGDGRDLHAGEDRRQSERQLHAQQRLAASQA